MNCTIWAPAKLQKAKADLFFLEHGLTTVCHCLKPAWTHFSKTFTAPAILACVRALINPLFEKSCFAFVCDRKAFLQFLGKLPFSLWSPIKYSKWPRYLIIQWSRGGLPMLKYWIYMSWNRWMSSCPRILLTWGENGRPALIAIALLAIPICSHQSLSVEALCLRSQIVSFR